LKNTVRIIRLIRTSAALLAAWTFGAFSIPAFAETSHRPVSVHDCERLAGILAWHPKGSGHDVGFANIDAIAATDACLAFVKRNPEDGFGHYLLARAFAAAKCYEMPFVPRAKRQSFQMLAECSFWPNFSAPARDKRKQIQKRRFAGL